MEAKIKAALEKSLEKDGETTAIPWHPAFVEALKMELSAYQEVLDFQPEYQLTSEPLRIDCVVIKKLKNVAIKKNIAAIFREWNLIEYKSPDDYVSVNDYYKVYGYAYLYASFENVPIEKLTISFVESRYPKKLLGYLEQKRSYTVAENSPGIYTIRGDIIPIQVIDSRHLSADENIWLKSLNKRLDIEAFRQISAEMERHYKHTRILAYLHSVTHANSGVMQEAIKMSKTAVTFDEVIENVGWAAKWETRGEERKAFSIAKNMVNMGMPIETVVSATQLDPEKIKGLYGSRG